MKNKFEEVFSEKNVEKMATFLVENIKEDTGVVIDYDFDLRKGQMDIEGFEDMVGNFSVKFDTKEDTIGRLFVETLSDEEEEVTEEKIKLFQSFLDKVKEYMTKNLKEKLKSNIRQSVFGSDEIDVFPLDNIQIISIDISDKPEHDKILVIQKNRTQEEMHSGSGGLAQEIFKISTETGETYAQIVARKQQEGNPEYTSITGMTEKQWWYEVHLNMFIDFSMVEPIR